MQIDGVRIFIGEGLCDNFTKEQYDEFIETGYCVLDQDLDIVGSEELNLKYYDTFTGVACFHFDEPVEDTELLMFFTEEELIYCKDKK